MRTDGSRPRILWFRCLPLHCLHGWLRQNQETLLWEVGDLALGLHQGKPQQEASLWNPSLIMSENRKGAIGKVYGMVDGEGAPALTFGWQLFRHPSTPQPQGVTECSLVKYKPVLVVLLWGSLMLPYHWQAWQPFQVSQTVSDSSLSLPLLCVGLLLTLISSSSVQSLQCCQHSSVP